jgi:hypothetical protein
VFSVLYFVFCMNYLQLFHFVGILNTKHQILNTLGETRLLFIDEIINYRTSYNYKKHANHQTLH